jgi:hypothetical protein
MSSSLVKDHRHLYKAKPIESSQNRRRAQELARQREARRSYADIVRNLTQPSSQSTPSTDQAHGIGSIATSSTIADPSIITTNTSATATASSSSIMTVAPAVDDHSSDCATMTTMDVAACDASTGHRTHTSRPLSFYANQLMLPEALQEVPDDLATNWYMMVVPKGQRCLVIASHGKTISRAIDGTKIDTFASRLPGGCERLDGIANSTAACILDCVLFQEIYFVLDILSWKGQVYYDCSSEFRYAPERTN